MRWIHAVAVPLFLVVTGCSTYRDDLARGQRAFEQNEHERALAILRALEPDTSHLTRAERVHYAYLRGMTDYRIGYKADARHWLAVAKALDEETPGQMPNDWRARLDEALGDLDDQVYAGGIESLTNARRVRGGDSSGEPAPRVAPRGARDDEAASSDDDDEAPKPKKGTKKRKKPANEDE